MNYPKLMLVSDNNMFWHKRVVLIHNKQGYIAFTQFESMKDLDKCECTSAWKYAKEIVEQKIIKNETDRNNARHIHISGSVDRSSNRNSIYNVEEIYS